LRFPWEPGSPEFARTCPGASSLVLGCSSELACPFGSRPPAARLAASLRSWLTGPLGTSSRKRSVQRLYRDSGRQSSKTCLNCLRNDGSLHRTCSVLTLTDPSDCQQIAAMHLLQRFHLELYLAVSAYQNRCICCPSTG